MTKIKKLYRPLRQHRYEILRAEHFTKKEAIILSHFKFKQSYIAIMRQQRVEMADRAYIWASGRELKTPDAIKHLNQNIRQFYKRHGYKDAYAWMRAERQKTLATGDYTPPPARKRPRLNKGNVAEQKRRWQERQARKRGQYDVDGKLIGEVVFNSATGKFEPKYA